MTRAERRRAAEELLTRKQDIARSVTDDFLDRHPDWLERYGEAARTRGEADAIFHIEFLAGAVVANEAGAFQDYAQWTAGVLRARAIAPDFLAENLEQVRDAAAAVLEGESRELVRKIADTAISSLRDTSGTAPAAEAGSGRMATETSLYLQAIRAGYRRAALNVALEALRAGASVPDVYGEILQPAQYRIGELWARNEITVAEEHMATAITQYVIGQLYSHLERPAAIRGNALVTGVKGELHQLGGNMVADVLEADGWNVMFLGTHLPHRDILQAVESHEPRLIGISATVLGNLPAVSELVEETRRRYGSEVTILVGGGAFRSRPDLWRELGADGFGRDLNEAVRIANELHELGS